MSVHSSEIKINAELKALRLAREQLGVTRYELARALGISYKAIEKIENGRMPLSQDRKEEILKFLGINEYRLKRIKKCGVIIPKISRKTVFENSQRRSYKRIVTKEVRVLKILRNMNNISQDRASRLCGYSRPSIGHIENGRIEIPIDRIKHIVNCYGCSFAKFEELMKEEILRDEIIKMCTQKIITLSEEKLKMVQSLLSNL